MAKNIEALLFDLGGVVIQNDINRIFARWAEHAGCDLADIRKKISFNEYYTRCECGETDITGYFAHLRTTHGINISDKQFLDGWNSIFVGEMPGISLLLEKAKAWKAAWDTYYPLIQAQQEKNRRYWKETFEIPTE